MCLGLRCSYGCRSILGFQVEEAAAGDVFGALYIQKHRLALVLVWPNVSQRGLSNMRYSGGEHRRAWGVQVLTSWEGERVEAARGMAVV